MKNFKSLTVYSFYYQLPEIFDRHMRNPCVLAKRIILDR